MGDRLIIVDGYNLILRTPQLKPGPDRTLREARDKLVNLLAWMMGGEHVRHVVVFDGVDGPGRDERSGNIEVRFSRPPQKADDLGQPPRRQHPRPGTGGLPRLRSGLVVVQDRSQPPANR